MVLSFIGAECCGWLFGSTRQRAQRRSAGHQRFVNTQFAAAAAAITWVITEWIQNRKPPPWRYLRAVAGLATITQASGFVQP